MGIKYIGLAMGPAGGLNTSASSGPKDDIQDVVNWAKDILGQSPKLAGVAVYVETHIIRRTEAPVAVTSVTTGMRCPSLETPPAPKPEDLADKARAAIDDNVVHRTQIL